MLNFTPSVQRLGCGNQNVNITKMWKYTCPTRMYAMRNSYKIFKVCGHFQDNLLNLAGFAQGVPTLRRFNLKDALRLHCPRNFQCPSSESICQIQKSFETQKWYGPPYLHTSIMPSMVGLGLCMLPVVKKLDFLGDRL